MAKKKAHEKQQKKKVRTHEGCGGELVRARNGGTWKMADFCHKCYRFLPKEG